jgi:cephalosporin hydroxylase
MSKPILTREEFEDLRIKSAREMAADKNLRKQALEVKVRAGHEYYWVHQTNWMGEPCLQLPQDMFAIQEAIYKCKPDYVVECGVAWGGTLLFYASLLRLLGGKKVIGVDIFIPDDLRERLSKKLPFPGAIELIEGSSVEEETAEKVRKIVGVGGRVMVLLDSHHTHEHVLRELRIYAPLVSPGCYLICGDTIIDEQPPADKRPRPWGEGNNPATALREFMAECGDFEVDLSIENKLLLSNMPGGYLRKKN